MKRDCPVAGKNILVTGAGGFIGSALVSALAASETQSLTFLDVSEQNLFTLRQAHPAAVSKFVVGSVLDRALLKSLFGHSQIDIVFHAAAYKHVELMELNPFAALKNNTLGTFSLAQAAVQNGCSSLIVISTDKAVKPHSIMGVSKRIAELIAVSLSTATCRINALRLTNVMDSTGSVVPIFRSQIAQGEPLTITHPDASRYFISIDEAITAILDAASCQCHGKILLPAFRPSVRIVDLAQSLSSDSYPISFIGLRPGEKLVEDLIGPKELQESLNVLQTSEMTQDECAIAAAQLKRCIAERNAPQLLELLTRLVPDYVPSSLILDMAA